MTLVLLSPLTYCSVYALCMPLRSLPSSSSLSPHRMAAAMAHRRLDVGLHPDRAQERTARRVELHTHRRRSQGHEAISAEKSGGMRVRFLTHVLQIWNQSRNRECEDPENSVLKTPVVGSSPSYGESAAGGV